MGLFGNKKKEEEKRVELPQLPPLPKLPDFPGLDDEPEGLSQLPVFPSSPIGTKFSQNTIKRAISGEKESESMDADEFEEDVDEMRKMQQPLKKPLTEEMSGFPLSKSNRTSGKEPVFIRIDKFQDALKVFNETKRKISEMETMIEEIKTIKEKEEKEMEAWENEVRVMKNQIEKIDQDIFSKI